MSLWNKLFGKKDEPVSSPQPQPEPVSPSGAKQVAEHPTMPTTPSPAPNRRIRVFISSTFRDMIGERDELMTHAWPELRRFCRERQVELVEVDLRWGKA